MRKLAVLALVLLIPLTAAAQFRLRPQMNSATVEYNSHFAFTRIRYGGGLGVRRRRLGARLPDRRP